MTCEEGTGEPKWKERRFCSSSRLYAWPWIDARHAVRTFNEPLTVRLKVPPLYGMYSIEFRRRSSMALDARLIRSWLCRHSVITQPRNSHPHLDEAMESARL